MITQVTQHSIISTKQQQTKAVTLLDLNINNIIMVVAIEVILQAKIIITAASTSSINHHITKIPQAVNPTTAMMKITNITTTTRVMVTTTSTQTVVTRAAVN